MPRPSEDYRPVEYAGADAEVVTRWRALLDQHAAISCALEKALQDEHGIGISEFEAMDRLFDRGCEHIRMADLAGDIYLSQSALSRTVARLEREQLVQRKMCSNDRRALFVELTDEGKKLHELARKTHRAVLAENLG